MILTGQCHCGKVKATFESQKTPQELGVRACQCDFCLAHNAQYISDPAGTITIEGAAAEINRYRFALRTADFLICKTCGVYIGAVTGEGDKIVSAINVVGLRIKEFDGVDEAPTDYDAETTDARIERRLGKWTPTRFLDPALAASNFGPH